MPTLNGRDFRFCIDRGGTFTDVYAEVPGTPGWRTVKLLSVDPTNYDDAPREGIRRILEEVTGVPIPRDGLLPTERIEWIRMGTTVATNALLERKGERTALCVTKGFRDLLRIGNQARPNIFDLKVRLPSQLYESVVEVDERVQLVQGDAPGGGGGASGVEVVQGLSGEWIEVIQPLQVESLRPLLQGLLEKGIKSLAVALLHSYTFPQHEQAVAKLAQEMGFKQVSVSSALMPMVRIVPRGHTAVVDAYLTPVIKEYLNTFLKGFDAGLPNVAVSFMQSDGGLTPAARFSGFKAILSGPAGGVVGYALTTHKVETEEAVIGFDMGGTSTDVSRYDGVLEQVLETHTAGVAIQAPQLDINTVAAGGGSRLHFQAGVFKVGPDSVGAHPGPVCYRKGGQLAVTDANLLLGRVLPDYFPKIFGPSEKEPLDVAASRAAFTEFTASINEELRAAPSGKLRGQPVKDMTVEEVALGFLTVANEAMCRAIRQLTEMKGYETSKHVLACFGGAGPQHACAMARALQMSTVVVHRFCGILSAYGMGLADVVAEAQEPCALNCAAEHLVAIQDRAKALAVRVKGDLESQGFKAGDITTEVLLNLRYQGTDTAIMCNVPEGGEGAAGAEAYEEVFKQKFRREYGFELRGRSIVVDDIRVRGVGHSNLLKPLLLNKGVGYPPAEAVQHRCYFREGWCATPVYMLECMGYGHVVEGPAIIMNGNSTIVVEPGCRASITRHGNVRIHVAAEPLAGRAKSAAAAGEVVPVDVIQLSLFSNRFMGIAEQMGRTLQRTAISTNIKERLDFSCALFSPDGGLVANAPHVPVHLGAMASTVRWQLAHWGDNLRAGDVLVSNHPAAGGSHLPDITVVTPVFSKADGKCTFLVASRGHHAEIGGITPGSMPPFSKTIFEEGAAIKAFKLVENGEFQDEGIRALLLQQTLAEPDEGKGSALVPGTRKIEDNISDLHAQVAANQRGILLIDELVEQYSLPVVQAYMHHVQANAESAVRSMLKATARKQRQRQMQQKVKEVRVAASPMLVDGVENGGKVGDAEEADGLVVMEAEDFMDDGSRIHLTLTIDERKGEAVFDFDGTSPEVYGNWNAPEAVTAAAVIYCLRCLVDEEIPLNQGCLAPVHIRIPHGCFLSPSDRAAVVGGNVLTSQRVTDVCLAAFQACACSQGDMNNLTFGDSTFGYYETIGGGCGAGPGWAGSSAVQCHMTNTRITDPEILERRYPVLLRKFGIREGSGGAGQFRGGDGIERELLFRRPVTASLLCERRVHAPHGALGGQDGQKGVNMLVMANGRTVYLGGKNSVLVSAGDILQILTPGGGGWGKVVEEGAQSSGEGVGEGAKRRKRSEL
eukprot:TRINITY_DN1098_c0_g3_i1.p1 TRINITY_DN1098_c0_g3~~TRINITY_DN1098_c0_g3_i1.p1  ORF type:complete len:1345 (+),score=297.98 TRINITY_DN1098_c0_g3_i1:213-4247(+)